MFAILFDSTLPAAPAPTFAVGISSPAPVRAPRQYDELGNRIPRVGYSASDLEWVATQLQARMDVEAELAEMAAEAQAARMEAEWLANLELARGPLLPARERDDMPEGHSS